MTFGANLAAVRRAAGLTQAELARKAAYSTSSIAHIEADRQDPTLAGMSALADALKVPLEYLVSGISSIGGSHTDLTEQNQEFRRVIKNQIRGLRRTADGLRQEAAALEADAKVLRALLDE